MKIRPPIDAVAAELEAWALMAGWKTVAIRVAAVYHCNCRGNLLPQVDSEAGLRNAVQRLRRIFRGYDGPRYASVAEDLKQAALAALPPERRAKLESPGDPSLLATIAAQEGIEAVNAVHLGAPTAVIMREVSEAIDALIAMRNSVMEWNIHTGAS